MSDQDIHSFATPPAVFLTLLHVIKWELLEFGTGKVRTEGIRILSLNTVCQDRTHLGYVKRNSAFEHAQNVRIYIILHLRKV